MLKVYPNRATYLIDAFNASIVGTLLLLVRVVLKVPVLVIDQEWIIFVRPIGKRWKVRYEGLTKVAIVREQELHRWESRHSRTWIGPRVAHLRFVLKSEGHRESNNLLSISETQMSLPISTITEYMSRVPQASHLIGPSVKAFREVPWRWSFYATVLTPHFIVVLVILIWRIYRLYDV